jgi:hypothetical protein
MNINVIVTPSCNSDMSVTVTPSCNSNINVRVTSSSKSDISVIVLVTPCNSDIYVIVIPCKSDISVILTFSSENFVDFSCSSTFLLTHLLLSVRAFYEHFH